MRVKKITPLGGDTIRHRSRCKEFHVTSNIGVVTLWRFRFSDGSWCRWLRDRQRLRTRWVDPKRELPPTELTDRLWCIVHSKATGLVRTNVAKIRKAGGNALAMLEHLQKAMPSSQRNCIVDVDALAILNDALIDAGLDSIAKLIKQGA